MTNFSKYYLLIKLVPTTSTIYVEYKVNTLFELYEKIIKTLKLIFEAFFIILLQRAKL